MKILGVGDNYPHNTTGRAERPVIFSKCDSALLTGGKPFFIPDFAPRCEARVGLVVHICRMGREIARRFAHRYYDAVTVGVDFTACDMLQQAREAGEPWELAKGFDSSACVGQWWPLAAHEDNAGRAREELLTKDVQDLHFSLEIDGRTVQEGHTAEMLFAVDEIIEYVSQFCMLRQGDLLFTGTPAGAQTVAIDQHLTGRLEGRTLLDFNVK